MKRQRFARLPGSFRVALLMLPALACGGAPSGDGVLVAIELEAMQNTLDGCSGCGCRAKGQFEPGTEQGWWTSFGLVTPGPDGGWQATGSASHCGSGSFQKVASDFTRTVGTPYVVLDLSASAAVPPEGDAQLEIRLGSQKLSGFDKNGEPVYMQRVQERTLAFPSEGELTLPVLVLDPQEKEAFAVHEVLLRLRATLLGQGPAASYGKISVVADVPGAEILLDGGFVGRILEANPVLLENVLTGTREIRVRDFSGREAHRQVVVEELETAEVALELLNPTPSDSSSDLLPIGKNPQGYEEYWRVKDGAMLVRIPAGEFVMGSRDDEGEPDEHPQHRVYVSEFLIDKTEVTWRQLRKFTEATGAALPPAPVYGTPDDYPASFILWEEARSYCAWVGGRLPTEAEWEKAARGTDGRSYPWGDTWDPRRCNSISGGLHRPESVGSYPGCVSPYGVLDMPGSMWEWCADRYAEGYYAESPSRDPKGPPSGGLRVKRGGAWMSQPIWLRTAYRAKAVPSSRNVDNGFRCAQDAPE